jgi:hypothetical protein
MTKIDFTVQSPRDSAFQNWDGTYRNLPRTALNPSDLERMANRGIPREIANEHMEAASGNTGDSSI